MYPTATQRPHTLAARCELYGYRSAYPTNSSTYSRVNAETRGRTAPDDLYLSNYDGYRYINRAGGGTYRPRRFMEPEKANSMNAYQPKQIERKPFTAPRSDKLGRPFRDNPNSKWEEVPAYRTSNRMAVPQPEDRKKFTYHGIRGQFTQGFLGNTYRNQALSTAIPESSVHNVAFFAHP